MNISRAFILVGGSSRRMGSPKHELRIDGQSVLDIQLNKLNTVFERVQVSCNKRQAPSLSEYDTLIDTLDDQGPLSGILNCLQSLPSNESSCFIMACDLLNVQVSDIELIAMAHRPEFDVTSAMASTNSRIQPLLGVWNQSAIPHMQSALESGQRSVMKLHASLNCQTVEVPEGTLLNANTMDTFKKRYQA